MKTTCSINGCREDLIWGLLRPDGRLSRFSFSKNLLEFLNKRFLDGAGTIQQFQFRKGKRLEPGEQSGSEIYAITAEQGSIGRTLRACYSAEQAAGLSDPGIRGIYELWILPPPSEATSNSSPSTRVPRPAKHAQSNHVRHPNNRSLSCPASRT